MGREVRRKWPPPQKNSIQVGKRGLNTSGNVREHKKQPAVLTIEMYCCQGKGECPLPCPSSQRGMQGKIPVKRSARAFLLLYLAYLKNFRNYLVQ